MAIGKYESIYNKLKSDIEVIQEQEEYNNLSLAFSHWFLRVQYNLSEQEIAESIIDGAGDYGIDAVIYNENPKELEIFQFKFPSKAENIKKETKQADVIKLINGFNLLIDQHDSYSLEKASADFRAIHDMLKDSEVYSYKINFVSFTQGIVDNIEVIENFILQMNKESGIDIEFIDYNVQKITNIYDKLQRQNSVQIILPYKQLQQTYSVNNVESYVGLINAKELLDSIEDKIGVIFDENIRLSENNTKVNYGIKNTASSKEDAKMFYFYNNGITFICDKVYPSPSSLRAKLEGASIVNGCQTVTSLYELRTKGELEDSVDILIRITKISDYDERAKITQFLNSQNPIKESYFISNHTIIRDLQKKLFEQGYYLERQINESSYKEKYLEKDIAKGKKIIKLGDVIQYYTGYYIDKLAATAKRNKNILFLSDTVEEILSKITPEGVVESYETYKEVAKVITAYRRHRRNKDNTEFADLLNITNEYLYKNEEKYLFVNTADILLLNYVKNLKNIRSNNSAKENIVEAINIIVDLIDSNDELKNIPPASLTKNQLIFTKLKEYFSKKQ